MIEKPEPQSVDLWLDAPPKPGRRLAAYLFDYYLFILPLVILVLPVVAADETSTSDPINGIILLLGLPFALFRAVCVTFAGSTPGKLIFGIWVEGKSGERLTVGRAINREFRVLFVGFGAAFLILPLLTGFLARKRLLANGQTSWDEHLGLRTLYRSNFNVAVGVVAFVLLFIGIVLFQYLVVTIHVMSAMRR